MYAMARLSASMFAYLFYNIKVNKMAAGNYTYTYARADSVMVRVIDGR